MICANIFLLRRTIFSTSKPVLLRNQIVKDKNLCLFRQRSNFTLPVFLQLALSEDILSASNHKLSQPTLFDSLQAEDEQVEGCAPQHPTAKPQELSIHVATTSYSRTMPFDKLPAVFYKPLKSVVL